MNFTSTTLSGVVVAEFDFFADSRGFFRELYQKDLFQKNGIRDDFTIDSISSSHKGVFRGLHYQLYPYGQTKLVQVLKGAIFDVIVDIRIGSPTFGKWFGMELSAENNKAVYIPVGFAHGFCVLSDNATVYYKCAGPYTCEHERTILLNDPALAIHWPMRLQESLLSEKDKKGVLLCDADINYYFKN